MSLQDAMLESIGRAVALSPRKFPRRLVRAADRYRRWKKDPPGTVKFVHDANIKFAQEEFLEEIERAKITLGDSLG